MSTRAAQKRKASAASLPTAGSHAEAAMIKKAKTKLKRANTEHQKLVDKLAVATRKQQEALAEAMELQQALDAARLQQEAAAAPKPPLPAHWEEVDPAHGNKVFVPLDEVRHAAELTAVKKHWTDTKGDGKIVSVFRVQNEAQRHRFIAAGVALLQSGQHVQLDVTGYHGTRANAPWRICESDTGFDVKKAVAIRGWLWVAAKASYSSKRYSHRTLTSELPFASQPAAAASTPNYTGFCTVLRVRLHVDHSVVPSGPPGRLMPMFGPDIFTTDKSEHIIPEYLLVYKADVPAPAAVAAPASSSAAAAVSAAVVASGQQLSQMSSSQP